MAEEVRMKIGIISMLIISTILLASSIGMAYPYSSSLSATGNVNVQYLSIDIYNESTSKPIWDEETSSIVLTIGTSTTSNDTVKEEVSATPKENYCIRASSNSLTSAYVYGYFTSSTNSQYGAAVDYLEVEFEDNSVAILYRNAFSGTLTDQDKEVESSFKYLEEDKYYCKDFVISSVTVHYYPEIPVKEDKVLYTQIEDGKIVKKINSDTDALTKISDFEFHFLASTKALLNSE